MLLLLTSLLLNQISYEMDEVVVTANRYPALLKDAAVAVIVIEREDIDKLSPISLSEILNAAAGIDFKDYGTPGGVTGISLRGVPSNGTLVLVNGQNLNAVTNGMADLSMIDVNTIERIEVVKGPVSSLYGANALGGVVNIITRRELSMPTIAMKFAPSTPALDDPLHTNDLFLKVGLPVKKTQFDIGVNYGTSDGGRSNSDLTRYNVSGSIVQKSERVEYSSFIYYTQKEYGIPGPAPIVDSLHPIPQFGDSTATSVFDRQIDRSLLVNLGVDLQVTDDALWQGKILADRKRTIFSTTYGGWWSGDTISEEYDYLTHMLGFNAMLNMRWEKLAFTLGFDATYDTLHTKTVSTLSGDMNWHASSYNVGVWTELQVNLHDILSATPSIRYDRNSAFGDFLSPAIGISCMPAEMIWLKLSIGNTFRAPTFNDLYWPQSGNPDLKPEHGWAYEIRIESSLLPNFFAAVSFFLRNVKDRIAWLPGDDKLWHPQNVNYLKIEGLDMELEHQIASFLAHAIELTFLNARQTNDEIVYDYYDAIADTSLTIYEEIERPAAFTPDFTISSVLDFSLPYGFGLNISGQYTSRRFNYYANYDAYPAVSMDTKVLDDYLVINTAVNRKFFNTFSLSVGIKNLFDTDYALQFGNTLIDLDYPMPRRTYFMQLSYNHNRTDGR
ncbi:MAG: TonB-dependent receptor [candidate division WOR-3 bacterium]|nr:MAG: TonB-dependent receptor [candidate division WOR-3 bacterium]